MNKCTSCNREYLYDKKKGHLKDTCNSCVVNTRRFQNKQILLDIFGNKCSICGYDRCKEALHFHHINPQEKSFGISGNHARSLSKLIEEAKKCILVCSNCHTEIHYGIITCPISSTG